ncbi:MAG: hypothetical protein OZSIB_3310 [Candidatus Ozemobacter sibiricus]|uniref:Uncharacterized protein n=1 Tax=Candidatus Ozemobacter sibiricus TaxID=2268124 RepID=A0A367ZF54_9BACT|nr:MAG: hypothetical protein OZSIB_3310 [Candidatus Ozemobacter sibiricus]
MIALRPEGGLLSWQDWMCDTIALLGVPAANDTPALVVFSYRTGAVLARCRLPAGDLDTLAGAHRYVLTAAELEGPLQLEGSICKLEPIDLTGGIYAGIQLQAAGQPAEALPLYARALAAADGLPRVRCLMAACHRLEHRFDLAERLYQEECERFPQFPDAFAQLGILYQQTDRTHLARTMFEQALERDMFCLNALLHLSRLLMGQPGTPPRMIGPLTHRLAVGFGDLPIVQEHLQKLAEAAGLSPIEFAARTRAEAGLVANPTLLRLMKRLESLRLNGAGLAALRGYAHLLEQSADTHLAGFFQHWVTRRLALFPALLPGFLQTAFDAGRQELAARYPGLGQAASPTEPGSGAPTALSRDEFYLLALEEVLLDGQITPTEQALLARLRGALRLDEAQHQKLFARAAALAGQTLADRGTDFDPVRFMRKLILAITRDQRVEAQERTFLDLAREALQLTPDTLTSILAEVNR